MRYLVPQLLWRDPTAKGRLPTTPQPLRRTGVQTPRTKKGKLTRDGTRDRVRRLVKQSQHAASVEDVETLDMPLSAPIILTDKRYSTGCDVEANESSPMKGTMSRENISGKVTPLCQYLSKVPTVEHVGASDAEACYIELSNWLSLLSDVEDSDSCLVRALSLARAIINEAILSGAVDTLSDGRDNALLGALPGIVRLAWSESVRNEAKWRQWDAMLARLNQNISVIEVENLVFASASEDAVSDLRVLKEACSSGVLLSDFLYKSKLRFELESLEAAKSRQQSADVASAAKRAVRAMEHLCPVDIDDCPALLLQIPREGFADFFKACTWPTGPASDPSLYQRAGDLTLRLLARGCDGLSEVAAVGMAAALVEVARKQNTESFASMKAQHAELHARKDEAFAIACDDCGMAASKAAQAMLTDGRDPEMASLSALLGRISDDRVREVALKKLREEAKRIASERLVKIVDQLGALDKALQCLECKMAAVEALAAQLKAKTDEKSSLRSSSEEASAASSTKCPTIPLTSMEASTSSPSESSFQKCKALLPFSPTRKRPLA